VLHLQRPLCVYSKYPETKPPLQVSFAEPHRNRRCVPRTLLYLSVAVPGERAAPLQVPHQGPDGGRCSSPGPTLHTSQNSQSRNLPPSSPQGPTETDAHPHGLLYISFIKPSKGSPPSRFSSQSPHREGHAISKTRLYLSLKGPGKEPPTWFPKWGPHGKSCPSLEPSYIHLLITHLRGKNSVHQAEPPRLVRLQYNWEVAWYPRGRRLDRLAHCDSSHRHGTHTVGLGIVFQGLVL
jgi:hypothetical protein